MKENLSSVLHNNGLYKYSDEFVKVNTMNVRYLTNPGKTLNNFKFELGLRDYHHNMPIKSNKINSSNVEDNKWYD